MKNIYILDTSAIISNPHCLNSFKDSEIIIQINVVNELDKLKTFPNEAGKHARVFVKLLDSICSQGNITEGVPVETNTLKIDVTTRDIRELGSSDYADNHILACAIDWKDKNKKKKVILVSKDINLRIRAKAFGVEAEDYNTGKINVYDIYTGYRIIPDAKLGDILNTAGSINCNISKDLQEMYPNECVCFENNKGTWIALGRKVGNEILPIKEQNIWNLKPKNLEQIFATEILLAPDIPLVSLIGEAGTGKSLLALAAGLELLISKKEFNKLIIYRPIEPMTGQDVGYLPGTMSEKIEPMFTAINDSFEVLLNSKKGHKTDWRDKLAQYKDQISFEPLTYIKGRSITSTMIIGDEIQSLSAKQVKAILTRCSKNSKIILGGDLAQIDSPYMSSAESGLTHMVEAFKDSKLSAHITLVKSERSPLAEEAAKRL